MLPLWTLPLVILVTVMLFAPTFVIYNRGIKKLQANDEALAAEVTEVQKPLPSRVRGNGRKRRKREKRSCGRHGR